MSSPRARLAVAALFFLGWVGYLVYLSATTTRPVVLSRPQFLAAQLYVIAGLERKVGVDNVPAEMATVREVVWADGEAPKKDERIVVKNLPDKAEHGWNGTGDYILALTRESAKGALYLVTPIPRSPGFSSPHPRIYPATTIARRELQDLKSEFRQE
ncbi:MAG: hypothetical protein L0Z62_17110 [Gemmataceae bacterium]|nr:hypothetical protein [Gemmataceae bacterium]